MVQPQLFKQTLPCEALGWSGPCQPLCGGQRGCVLLSREGSTLLLLPLPGCFCPVKGPAGWPGQKTRMLEEEDEAEPAAREGEKRLDSQGSDPALDTGLPAQTSWRAGCTPSSQGFAAIGRAHPPAGDNSCRMLGLSLPDVRPWTGASPPRPCPVPCGLGFLLWGPIAFSPSQEAAHSLTMDPLNPPLLPWASTSEDTPAFPPKDPLTSHTSGGCFSFLEFYLNVAY